MNQPQQQGDEEPKPTTAERLAGRPMKDVASVLRRVVAHAQYSDDAHFLYELAKLADNCGMLAFKDFCALIQMPGAGGEDNEQVGRFFRELQEKIGDLETQVREKSDQLALANSRLSELERTQPPGS